MASYDRWAQEWRSWRVGGKRVPTEQIGSSDGKQRTWTVRVDTPEPVATVMVHPRHLEASERTAAVLSVAVPGAVSAGPVAALVATRLAAGSEAGAVGAADQVTPRRGLLQSPSPSSCTMELQGMSLSFAACQEVTPGFEVFTSVYTGSDGSAWLSVGLSADAGDGWASFGLAGTDQSMVGSKVAVIAANADVPSGATISGYSLPAYSSTGVNAANGTFALREARAAAGSNGTLFGAFSVPLNETASSVLSVGSLDGVYAIGPLVSTGVLGSHATGNYPYGGMSANLASASVAVAPSSAGPSPVAEGSPPPSPGAVDPPSPSAVSPPSAAPSPSPTATSPPPGSSPGMASASCTLPGVGSETQSFGACAELSAISSGFNVLWNLDESTGMVSWALNTTLTDGWVAVGFPTSAGRMVGASAVILSSCSTCTGGVKIDGYYLAAMDVADVAPPSKIDFTDLNATMLDSSAGMAGTFSVALASLPGQSARRRRSLFATTDVSQNIIAATGPVGSDGSIQMHSTYGAGTLDLSASSGSGSVSATTLNYSLIKVHAGLLTVGWGVLAPTGILLARSFKFADPLWFHAHRVIMTLALCLVFAGFGIGFKISGGWTAITPQVATHRDLGMTIVVLAFVQIMGGVLKPAHDHRWRNVWGIGHRFLGRATFVIAIANIYYGYLKMADLGVWPYAVMSGFLGVIALVALVREVQIRRANHRSGSSTAKGGQFLMAHNPTADCEGPSVDRRLASHSAAPSCPGCTASSDASASVDDLKASQV